MASLLEIQCEINTMQMSLVSALSWTDGINEAVEVASPKALSLRTTKGMSCAEMTDFHNPQPSMNLASAEISANPQ